MNDATNGTKVGRLDELVSTGNTMSAAPTLQRIDDFLRSMEQHEVDGNKPIADEWSGIRYWARGNTYLITQAVPLLKDANAVLKVKAAGDDYAHRLAVMLECALLDRRGAWDDGHALLDEYRKACAQPHEDSPTHMGEPVLPPTFIAYCYCCGCKSDNPRDWMGRAVCSRCKPPVLNALGIEVKE